VAEKKFAVLLAQPELCKSPKVAGMLMAVRGIPLQDAASSARSCWGFLIENADERTAQDLATRFNQAGQALQLYSGQAAVIVPQDSVPVLPPAQPVSSLSFAPDGLNVILGAVQKFQVPFGRISLISAGAFKQKVVKTVETKEGPTKVQRMVNLGVMMTTGLPIKIGGKEKTTKKSVASSEIVFYADLMLRDPFERFRVDAQKFDYSCLGRKMLYNIVGNFRLLVTEWVKSMPAVQLNTGARAIFENKPLREMDYASLEEMERESRWLLALAKS
jgi:hypothetical protein